jgi:putative transposase
VVDAARLHTARTLSRGDQAADPERYRRWSFTRGRAAIKRLNRAFQAFFRRVKAREKPGYPRFKGRGWWDSVEWPAGNGAR